MPKPVADLCVTHWPGEADDNAGIVSVLAFLFQQVPRLMNFNWLPETSNEDGHERKRSRVPRRRPVINQATRDIYKLAVNRHHEAAKRASPWIINKGEI